MKTLNDLEKEIQKAAINLSGKPDNIVNKIIY